MSDPYSADEDPFDMRAGSPPDPAILAECVEDMVALIDRAAVKDFDRDDLYFGVLRLKQKCETAIFGADQRRALELVGAIEAKREEQPEDGTE